MGNKCCRGAPPVGPPEHVPVERIFRHYDKQQSGYWELENFVMFSEELLGYTSRKKQRQLWQSMVTCVHELDDPSELAEVAFAKVHLDEFRSYMMINQHPEYVRNLVRIFNGMLSREKTEEKYKYQLPQTTMEKSPKNRIPQLDSLPSNADVDIMTKGVVRRRSTSVSPASSRSRKSWRASRPGSPEPLPRPDQFNIHGMNPLGLDQANETSSSRDNEVKSPRLRLGVGGLMPIVHRSPSAGYASREASVSPAERARRTRRARQRHSHSSRQSMGLGDDNASRSKEGGPKQADNLRVVSEENLASAAAGEGEMQEVNTKANMVEELKAKDSAVAACESRNDTDKERAAGGKGERVQSMGVAQWMHKQLTTSHELRARGSVATDANDGEVKPEIVQGGVGTANVRRRGLHNRELTRDRELDPLDIGPSNDAGMDGKHTQETMVEEDGGISDGSTSAAEDNPVAIASGQNLSQIEFPLRLNKLIRGKPQQRWLTVNNREIFYSKSRDLLLNNLLLERVQVRLSGLKFSKWKKLKDGETSICWIPSHRILSIEIAENGLVNITTRCGPSRKTKVFHFDSIGLSNDVLVKELQKLLAGTRSANM
uniref:EF-hand domain-containing protein n=1 Tax=Lotharella oceanica TaxID=641309 RepID=A0A7S2XHJ9_9EUKA|mmetsp:Transcript_9352/g.18184  ORF Transcript_9352/g.18184 Transcript_9352/m.18184 type:complete len:600 (+) Transcript_9352:38-1837(+)